MRKLSLSVIIIISLFAASSCIKDRIQPPAAPFVQPKSATIISYWDFNNQDSAARNATFSINPGATFKYYCSYIDYTTGTSLNDQKGSDSGECLRLRNPFDSVVFYMPTTGYDSITIAFAEEATSSGPSSSAIYYTTDGKNYISTALGNNSYMIPQTFQLFNFSFISDPNVNNNPKFAIKIVPLNNNTGTSGNDRMDNVSISGVKE